MIEKNENRKFNFPSHIFVIITCFFFDSNMITFHYNLKTGVNPILQAAFTFSQMYFIFTYSRLMINKFKLIARIGLMHLVATNICVWIRTLGKEALHVSMNFSFNYRLSYFSFLPYIGIEK